MIVKITEPTPNILGTKNYPVGKEVFVTDYDYGNMIIEKYNAKRIDNLEKFEEVIKKPVKTRKRKENGNSRQG